MNRGKPDIGCASLKRPRKFIADLIVPGQPGPSAFTFRYSIQRLFSECSFQCPGRTTTTADIDVAQRSGSSEGLNLQWMVSLLPCGTCMYPVKKRKIIDMPPATTDNETGGNQRYATIPAFVLFVRTEE